MPDWMLKEWACKRDGLIPFELKCVNPASVDLRWSGKWRSSTYDGGWSEVHEAEVMTIQPQRLVLMDTLEAVRMPDDWAGQITLKSSIGRAGLEHMHAGWIDPGFCGTITLEMYVAAPWPVTIHKHQRLVQLTLIQLAAKPHQIYNGRYQGDYMPTPPKPEADYD